MREKYESLSLATLKDLAKARGLKKISTLRKQELIERMLQEDERDKEKKTRESREEPQQNAKETNRQSHEEAARQKQDGKEEKTAAVQAAQQTRKYVYTRNQDGRQYNSYVRDGGRREYTTHRDYDHRKNQDNRRSSDSSRRDYDNSRRDYSAQKREYESRKQDSENLNRETAFSKRDYDAAKHDYEPRKEPDGRETAEAAEQYGGAQRTAERAQGEYSPQNRAQGTEKTYDSSTRENTENSCAVPAETAELDSGEKANGILEVMPDGYGFIRCENYLPGENDVYVSPSQIRRFNLKTGDIIQGNIRIKTQGEKFSALLFVSSINGFSPSEGQKRCNFEDMTPIFPNRRLVMERPGGTTAMRIVDLISPIGKGQRGMIVSPPKAGKTTLLKDVARSILMNNRDMHLIILLIDERPEEVTDIKEAIQGPNVEVIYSTFDELPEHHKRVSEMVIERARRLVEHKKDVTILLDSITRLARAYNMIVPPSGRTLSGGLDPTALHMPKRFFGAARNMREGGSLTILATALVDTGSKMDDVVYEEFKGTGNMELVLDRKLQERRVFPAIDIQKSGTRREDLLLSRDEQEAVYIMRRALNGMKSEDAVEQILNMFARTRTNAEFVQMVKKQKFL